MKHFRIWLSCAIAIVASSSGVVAQSRVSELNQKTLTLLAGESQWMNRAISIAQNLQHRDGLKVLPVLGSGCIESVADLMQLSQIDVALLSADCVDYVQQQELLPKAAKKLTYIARVASVPVFIVTSRDHPTLTSLAGKRIATGAAHQAAFATGELLLGGLGLPFVRVARSGADGLALLKTGNVDAVLVTGTDVLELKLDANKFHALGLASPSGLDASFSPAIIPVDDLHGLSTQPIETVSTSLVLVAYDWPANSPKVSKIGAFAQAYVDQESGGAQAMQLSATVTGWRRERTAEKALNALPLTVQQNKNSEKTGEAP